MVRMFQSDTERVAGTRTPRPDRTPRLEGAQITRLRTPNFATLVRTRLAVIRCLPSSVDQLGHAVSLGGVDPGPVTNRPGHPNPAQPVAHR